MAEGPTRRQWWRKKPVKRATVVAHRWLSLVLGLVLLVITTTGAAVVYSPEWLKWTSGDTFRVTQSEHPVTFTQAVATVNAAHPGFDAGSVNLYQGLYEVYSADEEAHPGFYGVDPGTGRITGQGFPDDGFMGLMNQVHECFFTCDTYPAYLPFLEQPVPGFGDDLTWGSLALGVTGLLLLLLAVSGIWLWWPTFARFSHGFRVRWAKGRYARDYDLHQVVGMAAVPFLLVWGLTGASFEFPFVNTAWYAVTGGQNVPDEEPFTSVEQKAKVDIGLDAAIAAARTKAGSAAVLDYASLPAKDDATATYSFYFSKGFDQYRHGAYPGEYGVDVDRHDASRLQVNDYGTAPTLSNQLMDNWSAALFHYGQSVNGWWRIAWFLFGLTPLVLAVTGVSTWLFKRSVRKRRQRLTADRSAPGNDPLMDDDSAAPPDAVPARA